MAFDSYTPFFFGLQQAKAWRSVNDDLKSHAALAAHSEERISLLEKNSQVVNAKLAEQIPEIHDTLRKVCDNWTGCSIQTNYGKF